MYQIEREYNPETKTTRMRRAEIGIELENMPGMMVPNENYGMYFETGEAWDERKKKFTMLRDLFDRLYYEFQPQARRNPEEPVSEETGRMINSILVPIREMMREEDYAPFLLLIREGEEGHRCGEALLIMSAYKAAMVSFQNTLR